MTVMFRTLSNPKTRYWAGYRMYSKTRRAGTSVTSPAECRTDTPGVTLLDVKCDAIGSC